MPVYTYKAVDAEGRRRTGVLTANTAAAGRDSLGQRGWSLLEYAPVRASAARGPRSLIGGARRQERAAEFARQLSMLMRSGVPVLEGLDVLIRQERGRFLAVLHDVRDRVAAGTTLSMALERHSLWFDPVFCSAVRVGQASGELDAALAELAKFVRERQTLRTRVFTALAYPMILAVVGLGVTLFLMTYVVPQLLTVLAASGRSLPVVTMMLKRASDLFIGHWMLLSICAGAALVGVAAFYRTSRGRHWVDSMQVRLPLVGGLLRKNAVAQMAQVMAILIKTGVPFLDALRLFRAGTRNSLLAGELEAMETALERGSDLAPALAGSVVFPPLALHVLNVGQRSGALPEMLHQLREGYEDEVRLAVEKFTAVLEPMMIIVMSVIVGFIVMATLMPILEATRALT